MANGVGTPPNSKTAGPVMIFLLGIVFIFFAIHLFLAKVTTYLDPKMTFVIMMHSYFLKVIVILLFLV